MKYLLFVNFDNGLMHNAIHKTLRGVIESVRQLIHDEGLSVKNEKVPNIYELKNRLNGHDDYFGCLSSGTWFHIQPQNVFEIVK